MSWYNTGTVSVTNASATVTGSGTDFVAGAKIGYAFRGPDEVVYEIASIDGATQITLATNYGGGTASGQIYSIIPTQGLVSTLVDSVNTLVSNYSTIAAEAGSGLFADGSVSAPGISFTSDPDNGLYRIGTNNIGIATAGLKQLSIGATGNIGLRGIDAGNQWILMPDENDTFTGSLRMQPGGGSAGHGGGIGMYGHSHSSKPGDVYVGISSGSGGSFRVNSTGTDTGTDVFVVEASGNVGIGAAHALTAMLHLSSGGSTGEVVEMIRLNRDADDNRYNSIMSASNTAGEANIQFNCHDGVTATSQATVMTLKGSGNVGIGTTSPVAQLTLNKTDNTEHGITFAASGTERANLFYTNSLGELKFENTTTGRTVFWNNGAERMRINASGNVGIGTTAPGSLLEISGTNNGTTGATSVTNALRITDTDSTTAAGQFTGSILFETSDANSPGIQAFIGVEGDIVGAGEIVFGTGLGGSAAEAMRIDASGNIGIGSTPDAWGATFDALDIGNGGSLVGRTNSEQLILGSNAYYDTAWKYKSTAGASYINQSAGSINLNVAASGTADTAISWTPAVTINSSGNVGIGTTSPDTLLHLDDTSANAYIHLSGGGSLGDTYGGFIRGYGVAAEGGHLQLGVVDATVRRVAMEVTEQGNTVQFNTAGTERMRIDASGNVGIGTTNPVSQLTVSQSGATGLEVDVSTLATSVLLQSYNRSGAAYESIQYTALTHSFHAGSSPAEMVRIDSSGLSFDAGTNHLDDYEEGTWTPVYIPNTGAFATLTMDVVSANYIKIGNMVHFECYIRTDNVSIGTASGALSVSGLPFAATANVAVSVSYGLSWGVNSPTHGYIGAGTIITLNDSMSGANSLASDLTTGAIANQNAIMIQGTYKSV